MGWVKLLIVESTLSELPVDYRRIARRLRCRLGNDPISKQRALAALARHADRVRLVTASETAPHPDSGVRAFAEAVSKSLEGPILRFSRRQQLIRQAERLGIRRFDANLLIAAVQHRLGSERGGEAVQERASSRSSRFRLAVPIGLAIGVQAVIVLGAWGLLHS